MSKELTETQRADMMREAQQALDVQDACNLSGVVHAFSRVMSWLWTLDLGGTDAVNTHPLAILYADKVAHLTGTQTLGNETALSAYAWAYDQVSKARCPHCGAGRKPRDATCLRSECQQASYEANKEANEHDNPQPTSDQ